MDRINTATKALDLFGPGKHGFKDGNLSLAIQPTALDAAFFNDLQEEAIGVIEGAGLVPAAGNRTQLRQAIDIMIARATGNDFKASVRAATTANIASLAGGAPNTIDGVALAANDRVLVKDQATASQNGIYVVITLGTGANGTWTRATDADGVGELTSGALVIVEEGTDLKDSMWTLSTDGSITIGTTDLTWTRKDPIAGSGVQGTFKNLVIAALGVNNANIALTADELVLEDASNGYTVARAVNLTINSAAAGANGLDTGALAINTWYSVWVARKPDGTTCGLISLSATAPTLPSGYTYKGRFGYVRTDSSGNKYLLQMKQAGRQARYVVAAGTNLPALPMMAAGALGSPTVPTWSAVSVGSFVPPTASSVVLAMWQQSSNIAAAAPNASYGSVGSTTNPPPFTNTMAGSSGGAQCSMLLESTNVYYASNTASSGLQCVGWEDNL